MWDEIMEQPMALKRCSRDLSIVFEAVKTVRSRNIDFVYIVARGTSDHAAVYGKYLIETTLGIPVVLAASSVLTIYGRELNLKNALVVGISQSGKAADALEVIKSANNQGAITLTITNAPDSPLAREAQFHLYCNAEAELSVAATKTFTTEIFLLAQLVAEWAEDNPLRQELAQLPEKIKDTLEMSRNIADKVIRFRFMNECFVLARGINYAIALETALKIQETNYVRAKAFATSDFWHGPIAMVNRELPIFLLAPTGPSLDDVRVMIDKLRQDRAELVIISNQNELLDQGTCSFAIPSSNNDVISAFFNVVVAQMFACQLALIKRLNPDSPRGLNKVTITK
jgi:Glucosamine 6-phosphate synthetase, contains amidotransferase and phosphosugar isomerase domains